MDTSTATPVEMPAVNPGTDSDAATVTVRIPREQFLTLQDLADQQGINPSEAIAQAIGIARIVVNADRAEDERVLIQKGKKLQVLTLA